MVSSSPLVIRALRVGSSASSAFSRSSAARRSACRFSNVMTDCMRSCEILSVTWARRRWRSMTRQSAVTITVTTAMANTSNTWVFNGGKRGSWPEETGRASWDKFVSCAIDCKQMRWLCRIGLKLLTQFQDLVVDGPRCGIGVIPPDLIQKDLACEYTVWILSEELQQLELVRGEYDWNAASLCGHTFKVYFAVGKPVDAGNQRPTLPADGGLHAGEQFTWAVGFGDVVIGT